MSLMCRLLGHRIAKNHVWHDNVDFRTSCKRCGEPMLRDQHGWRPFDRDGDFELARRGKPHGEI
jgi:hypothetical protein